MRRHALAFAATLAISVLGSMVPAALAASANAGLAPARDPIRIAAGGNQGVGHVCQVKGDGNVRCWGSNAFGELGDGTTTGHNAPVLVSGLTNAVSVAAGDNHTCALIADGTARCWGSNIWGQLGDGTTSNRGTPVSVSGLTNAVAIVAGGAHTCALLASGTVRCWGYNASGELGDQTTNGRPTPVTVFGLTGVTAIAAGRDHSCALIADGTARCWGSNQFGQLGDNSTSLQRTAPVAVSNLVNAKGISAGSSNSCAVIADGTARCWGANSTGSLGDGTFTTRRQPAAVVGLTNAVTIAVGAGHACALLGSGHARCWGWNYAGQLGTGSTIDSNTPVAVSGLVSGTGIAAANGDTCAEITDESVRCWGDGTAGQIGDGTSSTKFTPTTVSGGGGSVTARAVATGYDDQIGSFTCALRANSTVSCWGTNGFRQLGVPISAPITSPVAVPLTNISAIAVGQRHACALVGDGSARCWGDTESGQLGNGVADYLAYGPDRVQGLSDAIGLAAGYSHSCALVADGTVRCWGDGLSGDLGDGTTNMRTTSVAVTGLTNAVAIATGVAHSCALLASGGVRCWGNNFYGQLGDTTTTNRLVPVAVNGLTNAVAIAAGSFSTCALLADGGEKCWGNNVTGQLGDGTTTRHVLPAPVSGLANATVIAAGGDIWGDSGNACAITSGGSAFCWGANTRGQVGDGSTTQRLTPVKVLTKVSSFNLTFFVPVPNVIALSVGTNHACAISASGALWCWGANDTGQIGDGTTTDRLTAIAVPSFTLNIDPHARLSDSARTATIGILATCAAGDRLHVHVDVSQPTATGSADTDFKCTGGLRRYPLEVPATGSNPFTLGAATVSARATIRDRGSVVDNQSWTRAVTLEAAP